MELINSLTNHIMHIVNEIGYISVVIITPMEYACFPAMPSEVILPNYVKSKVKYLLMKKVLRF